MNLGHTQCAEPKNLRRKSLGQTRVNSAAGPALCWLLPSSVSKFQSHW